MASPPAPPRTADRVARELEAQARAHKARNRAKHAARRLLPSPEATTNLLIADIIMRSGSELFRRDVERRVARGSATNDQAAQELLDGRTLIRSFALYGASKLATRSPLGLGLVAGGLALKTLYDLGKARQQREARAARKTPDKN